MKKHAIANLCERVKEKDTLKHCCERDITIKCHHTYLLPLRAFTKTLRSFTFNKPYSLFVTFYSNSLSSTANADCCSFALRTSVSFFLLHPIRNQFSFSLSFSDHLLLKASFFIPFTTIIRSNSLPHIHSFHSAIDFCCMTFDICCLLSQHMQNSPTVLSNLFGLNLLRNFIIFVLTHKSHSFFLNSSLIHSIFSSLEMNDWMEVKPPSSSFKEPSKMSFCTSREHDNLSSDFPFTSKRNSKIT